MGVHISVSHSLAVYRQADRFFDNHFGGDNFFGGSVAKKVY
jgi:hypothetical protein